MRLADLRLAGEWGFELLLPPGAAEAIAEIAGSARQPVALDDPPGSVGSLHKPLSKSARHRGYPTSARERTPVIGRSLVGPLCGLLLAAFVLAAPVVAQDTDGAISGLTADSVYVEDGAEAVDQGELRQAASTAAGHGVDLRIAVLASGADAEALAGTIASRLDEAATVLVFTPTSYGVFSDELSQDRLDDALTDAADELSSPDSAAGAAAFAAALDPDRDSGGVSIGLVIGAIAALLVVVGVGGRLWEVRTRDARQARRRNRRRQELTERTRRIADRVLQLSDPVELAGVRTLSSKYAEAAATFDEAELAIAGASTMHDLDAVEAGLRDAERLLDEVENGLSPS
jgi:hypothetical protein